MEYLVFKYIPIFFMTSTMLTHGFGIASKKGVCFPAVIKGVKQAGLRLFLLFVVVDL